MGTWEVLNYSLHDCAFSRAPSAAMPQMHVVAQLVRNRVWAAGRVVQGIPAPESCNATSEIKHAMHLTTVEQCMYKITL